MVGDKTIVMAFVAVGRRMGKTWRKAGKSTKAAAITSTITVGLVLLGVGGINTSTNPNTIAIGGMLVHFQLPPCLRRLHMTLGEEGEVDSEAVAAEEMADLQAVVDLEVVVVDSEAVAVHFLGVEEI